MNKTKYLMIASVSALVAGVILSLLYNSLFLFLFIPFGFGWSYRRKILKDDKDESGEYQIDQVERT